MNKIVPISYDEYINQLYILDQECKKFTEKLNLKYAKLMTKDIEYIIRSEVDRFYEDYEPGYDRYGSLYDIFKVNIDVDKQEMTVDIDYTYMKNFSKGKERRLNNKGIFDITMQRGWHGGAIPKNENAKTFDNKPIQPNIPYWRTRDHKNWWKPARIISGEPPIERMEKQIKDYIEEKNKEFMDELTKYNDSFKKKLIRIVKNYNLGIDGG